MDKNYGYKHTKGFILFFVIVLLMSIGAAYAQVVTGSPNTPSGYSIDATTGNLVNNPAMTTSTGWTTGGMTGSFVPDGYTFSYATGTIQQTVNLAGISTGYQNTGAVFVTGVSYGFKYRFQCANSIGGSCDNTSGLQDNLSATATYYKPDNTVDWSQLHQLGLKNINDGNSAYNPTWQQLSETHTFAGAKPLAQVGTFNLKITGSDAGFWACLGAECYGPQVKDAYVRANYSVDPCVLNPAFNSSCPGFQNIIQGTKTPTFYYSYNIAQSLPHIGGGVILHGYDYGFNWYNYGACYNTFMFWCTDWRSDGGGNINFRISDKNNTTMLQQQWYVAGNNSGGSYSNRHLFTESRNSLDMGSVQWWTSDVWNHFGWVGWTKPIWTPDPCYSQPLYSPNCSNFDAEIKRIATEIKATQDARLSDTISSSSVTPGGTVTNTIIDATSTNPSVSTTTDTNTRSSSTSMALSLISKNQQRETNIAMQASQQAMTTANVAAVTSVSQAESIAADAATNSTAAGAGSPIIATSTVSTQSATVIGPAPGSTSVVALKNPDASAVSDSNVSQETNTSVFSVSPVNLSSVNVVSTDSTTSTSVFVVNVNTRSDNESVRSDPAENLALVPPQLVTSVSNSQASSTIYTPPQINTELKSRDDDAQIFSQGAIEVKILQAPQTTSTEPIAATTTSVSTVSTQIAAPEPPPAATFSVVQINPLQAPQPAPVAPEAAPGIANTAAAAVVTADVPQPSANFVNDRTNPINEIIETKPMVAESNQRSTQTTTVKPNVQDNDAAGGVSIASIARTPAGFNSYMIALADANFYAPKEIYRNQRNVDNTRLLRQLATDRLHQEMVDQQYRR